MKQINQYTKIAKYYSKATKRAFRPTGFSRMLVEWGGFSDEHKVVLDIGCGDGTYIDFARHHFATIEKAYGIDISSDMIELAKKSYTDIDFRVESMVKTSLEDASIDFTFGRLSIHYSDSLDATMSEIARITRSGGIFFFQDVHPVYSLFVKKSKDYEKKEKVTYMAHCDDELLVEHPCFTFKEYLHSFARNDWTLVDMNEIYGRRSTEQEIQPYRVPTSVCFTLRKN